MSKRETSLLCRCETPLSSDDYEYHCENCGIRFPQYVIDRSEEKNLTSILTSASKDRIKIAEILDLIETREQVEYCFLTYTFRRKDEDWSLEDVKETRRVWKDMDPQEVSDEIQRLNKESAADFYFSKE